MFEIVVRAFIVDNQGRVLFQKRAKNPEKNKWALPGGKVEEYEKAEDAIVREVKEELGITFYPRFYSYAEGFFPERKIHCLVLHFSGTYQGKITTKKNEVLEVKFFSLENIENNNDFAWDHKQVITDYLSVVYLQR